MTAAVSRGPVWELAVAAGVALVLVATWLRARSVGPAGRGRGNPRTKLPFEVWAAQGFGAGWAPVAPGTFGSVVGLLWTAALLRSGSWMVFAAGIVGGFGASVWLCDHAERFLKEKDPGSVVLDEITAVPLCFVAWLGFLSARAGELPPPAFLFSKANWLGTLAIFAAFRFFDVLKPWPVRQSQTLPGGWGVTVDDFLAACYVNAAALAFLIVAA